MIIWEVEAAVWVVWSWYNAIEAVQLRLPVNLYRKHCFRVGVVVPILLSKRIHGAS